MMHYILRIDAADRAAANAAAVQWDPTGGDQTFPESLGLSPTGEPPATHYWRRLPLTPETHAELVQLRDASFPTAVIEGPWEVLSAPSYPDALLVAWGLQPVGPDDGE